MSHQAPPEFLYYITDTANGIVLGTNDLSKAIVYAASDEYFVVDAFEGKLLTLYDDVLQELQIKDLDDDSHKEGY